MRQALLVLAVTVFRIPVTAENRADILLRPQGPNNFPALYREALNTFVEADENYRKGQYAEESKKSSPRSGKHTRLEPANGNKPQTWVFAPAR
ncbi:MAG TPA: hypothetical protein VKU01_35830 [Bryobacteraceae bacterium]|nr:hypothetical protein [Bryobacteraceae bacterium]